MKARDCASCAMLNAATTCGAPQQSGAPQHRNAHPWVHTSGECPGYVSDAVQQRVGAQQEDKAITEARS